MTQKTKNKAKKMFKTDILKLVEGKDTINEIDLCYCLRLAFDELVAERKILLVNERSYF